MTKIHLLRRELPYTMLSFISPAYAAGSTPTDFLSFLPLLAVLVVMYFFFFRTQQKKDKQHKELLSNLRRGDRVLTNGGLIGVVTKVGADSEIVLEIAEGVKVSFLKGMISSVLGKEPVSETSVKEKSQDIPSKTLTKEKKSNTKPKRTA